MKTIFFQNLIAPYRVALFNDLEQIRKTLDADYDFEVYFMRQTEEGRHWNIDFQTLKFKYKLGRSLYFNLPSYHFHFNPLLLFYLIKNGDQIILGGSWNNFNVLILIVLKRLGVINNKLHIWSEANYLSLGSIRNNKLRDFVRSFVFNSIDGAFLIPGEMPKETFKRWGIIPKTYIYFPNLVDISHFKRMKFSERENRINEIPRFLIIASLEEKIKGILNFIKAIGTDNIKNITLLIAGVGSSFDEYMEYIRTYNLGEHIVFLGYVPQDEIRSLLQQVDVFVLPSFSDQSPLSVVEAIFMGKPVLLSNHCGNHYETIVDGENGKIFDPLDENSIKSAFEYMLQNKDRWHDMGNKSHQLAINNFDNAIVLSNFINEITSL